MRWVAQWTWPYWALLGSGHSMPSRLLAAEHSADRDSQAHALSTHFLGGGNSGLTSTPPLRVAGCSLAICTATSKSGADST